MLSTTGPSNKRSLRQDKSIVDSLLKTTFFWLGFSGSLLCTERCAMGARLDDDGRRVIK